MTANAVMAPVHPGEILLEEFLEPLAVGQYKLAKEIGIPARRINTSCTAAPASARTRLRLAHFFVASDLFWINLQARYDLKPENTGLVMRPMGIIHSPCAS